ncbi:hypothetical protein DXD55_13690 [Bacteroides stercoris]|nr:hypothetical protein DXD55_13690 [Bacteroides stercoris]
MRKKNGLVGNVRTKMYLCHSEILMPKDTESLGNNKAPACESRGFVRKIMKVCILTHLHLWIGYALVIRISCKRIHEFIHLLTYALVY